MTPREFTLDNGAGLSLSVLDRGGTVTALRVPDRHGRVDNVVLCLPEVTDYLQPHPHLGTLVGRYANRIAGGRFSLDGREYTLPRNDGVNTLHGGPEGFGRQLWEVTPVGATALELRLTSEDGDQGFPGRLEMLVRYTLTSANEWRIDYQAHCDRATVLNPSHHAYFNLAGRGSILDHRLRMAAGRYCAVDGNLIPQALESVEGTPFDFRESTAIGKRIAEAGGYDHNWVLDGEGLRFAARLEDPHSGRVLEIGTTEPGLQFYSGNFLDGSVGGHARHAGLCLETQHFPDSPNRPDFPSTLLRPGEVFRSTTVHRFSASS